MSFNYKNAFKSPSLAATRIHNNVNISQEEQSDQTDLLYQSHINTCNSLILTSFTNFQQKDFNSFFRNIRNIVAFFDQLYDTKFDIDLIFPAIFNPYFNTCLINSLDETAFSLNDINEVLKIIYTISFYPGNFNYFRNSPLFHIAFHLLTLKDEIVYLECISIINQYMVIFQTTQFPFNLNDYLQVLKELSNYMETIEYTAENLKLFIYYVDISKYLVQILFFINTLISEIDSVDGLNDMIESITYIINSDPLNYALVFQSKIIHTFIYLLQNKFLNNIAKYQPVILSFFQFLCTSFQKISSQWLENTIKVIDISTFTAPYQNDKINLAIHQIIFQYLQHCDNINEEIPLFSAILNSGFVHNLVKTFDDQTFEIKKQILIIIHKLLKTQNTELFFQLVKYDDKANFFDICTDFAISVNDDFKIQTIFLESLIDLVQIAQKFKDTNIITISPIVDEFVSFCTSSEDQNVQRLAYYYFNLTTA